MPVWKTETCIYDNYQFVKYIDKHMKRCEMWGKIQYKESNIKSIKYSAPIFAEY